MSKAETVEAFLDRVRSAWNAGDAVAYGELFAVEATYVIFLGEVMLGREEIVSVHRDVFAKWQKGTRMAVRALSARPVGEDTVAVVTVGGIGKGASVRYDKLQTFTLRMRDGRYECVAFQNTEMNRRAKKVYGEQVPLAS